MLISISNMWWSTFATRFSMVTEVRAASSTSEKPFETFKIKNLQVFILSAQASAEICGSEIQGH